MASFLQRCSDEEKQSWVAAAKSEGVSLAGWVRSRLNAALTEGDQGDRTVERGAVRRPATTALHQDDPAGVPAGAFAPSRSVKAAKPKNKVSSSAQTFGRDHAPKCPHGLPKGFCLNPRCK